MRRIASYMALLLLLAAVVPAFACATSASFTPEERACCKTMQGQCGEMAGMKCCQTQVHMAHLSQLATSPHVPGMQWVVLTQYALPAPVQAAISMRLSHIPEEYPPPGRVTARSTVLRV